MPHTIDPILTVNEILQRYPNALVPLAAHGIDSCCRGNQSLAMAAAASGVELTQLRAEIATAVLQAGGPALSCACGCASVKARTH